MNTKALLPLLLVLFFWVPLQAQDKSVVEKMGDMLSPGPLSKSHAYLETTLGCLECHSLNKGVSDLLCLDCHQEIKSRLDQREGWHGIEENRKKDCLSCHTDHKGRQAAIYDKSQVDHAKLDLALTGEHQPVECKECHQTKYQSDKVRELAIDGKRRQERTYLGLDESCQSCHGKEHGPQFKEQSCTDCHTAQAWSLTKFDHEKGSTFKLRGKHTQLTCKACHQKDEARGDFVPYQGIEHQCDTCHLDPHQGKSGDDCASCHRPEGWMKLLDPKKAKNFDHNKTRFKLIGRHKRVDCEKCHVDPQKKDFRGKGFARCTDCHKDRHNGQFPADTCERCHNLKQKWDAFDHSKTPFPIKQLHQEAQCKECHPKGQYVMEEKATCEGCHHLVRSAMEGAWLDKSDHPVGPDPMFRTVDCATCHQQEHREVDPKKVRKACVECHNDHFGDLWDYRLEKYGPRKEAQDEPAKKKRLKQTHRFGDFIETE